MPTTRTDIRRWLDEAMAKEATHMIVATDTFDCEDYPVFASKGEDVRRRLDDVRGSSMQTITEVYDMSMPLEPQLDERRAYHLD